VKLVASAAVILPVNVPPVALVMVTVPGVLPAVSLIAPVKVPLLLINRLPLPVADAVFEIAPVKVPVFVMLSGAAVAIAPVTVPPLVSVVLSAVVIVPVIVAPLRLLISTVSAPDDVVCVMLPLIGPELLIVVLPIEVILPTIPFVVLRLVSVFTCGAAVAANRILPVIAPEAPASCFTNPPPPSEIAVTPAPVLIVPLLSTELFAPTACSPVPVIDVPLVTVIAVLGVEVEKPVEEVVQLTFTPVASGTQSAQAPDEISAAAATNDVEMRACVRRHKIVMSFLLDV